MASSQLAEPVVTPSNLSNHSREDDQYSQQQEEHPLEVVTTSSVQSTSSRLPVDNPLERIHTEDVYFDEPPPPYEEPAADAPEIAAIEYSCENSPQLLVQAPPDFSAPVILRSSSSLPGVTPILSSGTSAFHPSPVPTLIGTRGPESSNGTVSQVGSISERTFSSTKAREAGFEIEPTSPRRTDSMGSLPSITLLSSSEPLRHTRSSGSLIAYIIPFPKPRIKNIDIDDIPDRFFIYTPPLPPLSKPAPGEKESHWHKTKREWQEDVRKSTLNHASLTTWKGMKAKSTSLIGKGMDLTRSSNVEFLDRAAEGAIESKEDEVQLNLTRQSTASRPAELDASEPGAQITPDSNPIAECAGRLTGEDAKPKSLEQLTLIYPPTLALAPEKIREEFVNTLLRTRERSRKEAIIASALLPIAATIDASLLITFGGLTEISGVWAYTNIRGAKTSKKITQGLSIGEAQATMAKEEAEMEPEVRGCTCGHHEHDFGSPEIIPRTIGKGKGKKKGIDLRMQQSNQLEILRRYLNLACLKREFNMFPVIETAAGDVNEEAVLEAIGWQPTRRQGRDLELDLKDKIETLTPEQDEEWQHKEARADIKRVFRKGAAEWVTWIKSFQKDPEVALKR